MLAFHSADSQVKKTAQQCILDWLGQSEIRFRLEGYLYAAYVVHNHEYDRSLVGASCVFWEGHPRPRHVRRGQSRSHGLTAS